MLLLASCEPVTQMEYIAVTDNETVSNAIIDEMVILLDNDDTFITEENLEMSDVEEVVIPDPITEYGNYITMDNKVVGIDGKKFIDIPDIKGLFIIDEVLFFEIGDKKYSQVDKVVTVIDDSDYPSVPDSEFIEYGVTPYKIVEDTYKGEPISKVYQGSLVVAYMKVDSCILVGNNLWYSVSIGITGRESGIYCWSLDGNTQRKYESGRIW